MVDKKIVCTGIWLRSIGAEVEVLVEINGEWKVAIKTSSDPLAQGVISHIAEPAGQDRWPKDEVTDKK